MNPLSNARTDSSKELTQPLLTTTHTVTVRKQLDAIESIERRQNSSLLRLLSCKCLLSTCMLVLFIFLAVSITRSLLDHSLHNNTSFNQDSTYDFIIIGAGPAGCILSRKFVDSGATVLLLEAGEPTQYDLGGKDEFAGPITRFDIPFLWSSISHYSKFLWDDSPLLLAKGLGGNGVHNAMIYIRALASDIEEWNVTLGAWKWSNFLSTYKSLEHFKLDSFNDDDEAVPSNVPHYHGIGGPIQTALSTYIDPISSEFISSAAQYGLPFNEDFNNPEFDRIGVGYYHFNIRNGIRDSAAKTMLKPILEHKKFNLLTSAYVNKIIIKSLMGKQHAVGVEYTMNGLPKTAYLRVNSIPAGLNAFPSGCVILTAGAILTPKLLLVSGIGASSELSKIGITPKVDLPAVGGNLQDHPSIGISFSLSQDMTASFPSMYEFPSELFQYSSAIDRLNLASIDNRTSPVPTDRMPYLDTDLGVLASVGLCAGGFLRSPLASSDAPDVQLTVYPAVTEPHLTSRTWSESATPRRVLLQGKQMLVTVALLQPDTRARVILNASNPQGAPDVVVTKELSTRDVNTLVWALGQVLRVVNTPPLESVVSNRVSPPPILSSHEELSAWVRSNVFPSSHYVGSARMGVDEDSVVDERLRVRGVANLRIADASVIPKIPNGNIHATVTAVASIAADVILMPKQ